jgi:PhzF family phenazine biosynthesis protein
MQRIALENNLPETAFFVKRGDVYEIRWFTPMVEVNLCGHATLASSYVIFECLGETADVIKLHSDRSGDLSVEKQGKRFILDFPAYGVNELPIDARLARAVGKMPRQMWETQGNMVVMLFEHESDIAEITPDMSALAKIEFDEIIVTARGESGDFVSRMFAPRIGIPEDPVTGAIHCSLIPFWSERLGKTEMFARQISARGGELFCELRGDRVKIGGNATLYLKGEIYV